MTRLLHPIPEGAAHLGVSRTTFYKLVKDGEISTVKIGRRTFVSHDELLRYVDSLQRGEGHLSTTRRVS